MQQCMQPTGTNRSIGLISLPRQALTGLAYKGRGMKAPKCPKPRAPRAAVQGPVTHARAARLRKRPSVWFLDDLVALAKVPAPDPISNSEVKAFSAHGTAS